MIDNLILETFETHDEFSYPIRRNSEARTFVRHLQTKGLSYTTLCQEVDATEVGFSSWMKGVNRTGIGRRVIDRINQQFRDILVSDSDSEQAGSVDCSTDYFKRKAYTRTDIGAAKGTKLVSRFPLRSNGKVHGINALGKDVATNGHAQDASSPAKRSSANDDKPDMDVVSTEPNELKINNVCPNIIAAESLSEICQTALSIESTNASLSEPNLKLNENCSDSGRVDESIVLASLATEDYQDQNVKSGPSDFNRDPEEQPSEYPSTAHQNPSLIVAAEIDPDSKAIEPDIQESIDTKRVDDAATVVDVDTLGTESDDLICTSNHVECSDPINIPRNNPDIEDTENFMFNKSLDGTVMPCSQGLQGIAKITDTELLTGSIENIENSDRLISRANTEVNERTDFDDSGEYEKNKDSKFDEADKKSCLSENVQSEAISTASLGQCTPNDVDELTETNISQVLEEGSSVDYDNIDTEDNLTENKHISMIELKLTSSSVDAVQQPDDVLYCSSPRRITVLEKSSFMAFADEPNNGPNGQAQSISEFTSEASNQFLNEVDHLETAKNHVNEQRSSITKINSDNASQPKGFGEQAECFLDQPAMSAMTDSMDNEFLLCIQQIESSIINFSELANAAIAMESEQSTCAPPLPETAERQPSLTSSVSDENFSDYENVPSRTKVMPDYENIPKLSNVILKSDFEVKQCDLEESSAQSETRVISSESCLANNLHSNVDDEVLDVGNSPDCKLLNEILSLDATIIGKEEDKREGDEKEMDTTVTEEDDVKCFSEKRVTNVAEEGNTAVTKEGDNYVDKEGNKTGAEEMNQNSIEKTSVKTTLISDESSHQENIIFQSENHDISENSVEVSSNVVENVFVQRSTIVENMVLEPSKGEYIYVLSDSTNDSSLHRVKIGICQEPFQLIQQAKLFNVDIQLVSATLVSNGDVVLQAVYKRLEERKICGREEWFVCSLATVLQTIAEAVNQ